MKNKKIIVCISIFSILFLSTITISAYALINDITAYAETLKEKNNEPKKAWVLGRRVVSSNNEYEDLNEKVNEYNSLECDEEFYDYLRNNKEKFDLNNPTDILHEYMGEKGVNSISKDIYFN